MKTQELNNFLKSYKKDDFKISRPIELFNPHKNLLKSTKKSVSQKNYIQNCKEG